MPQNWKCRCIQRPRNRKGGGSPGPERSNGEFHRHGVLTLPHRKVLYGMGPPLSCDSGCISWLGVRCTMYCTVLHPPNFVRHWLNDAVEPPVHAAFKSLNTTPPARLASPNLGLMEEGVLAPPHLVSLSVRHQDASGSIDGRQIKPSRSLLAR